MEVELISQPGDDASVEGWELGSNEEVGWGKMGVFTAIADVCAPLCRIQEGMVGIRMGERLRVNESLGV